jgi:tRNA(Leu) C34 or U34 (ribose-2'-O)-methylase TrmL
MPPPSCFPAAQSAAGFRILLLYPAAFLFCLERILLMKMIWRNGSLVKEVDDTVAEAKTPSVILINPKYPHNVGGVVRAASCFGMKQVWFTGHRVPMVADGVVQRIPREERMKGYADIDLINYDMPLRILAGTPVAVEVRENSEDLTTFEHPEDAVYVFGPEDGSLERGILNRCHRFVVIPSAHCLNLTSAVSIILYDRTAKQQRATGERVKYVGHRA